MIEDGIRALALADPDTAALIADRFLPNNLPAADSSQQAPVPAVTYRVVSTTEDYTNDGPLGLVTCRLQLDCWAETYKDAKAVATALRAVLNGYSGTLPNGCEVFSVTRDSGNSGFDEYVRLPFFSTDWLIQYSE